MLRVIIGVSLCSLDIEKKVSCLFPSGHDFCFCGAEMKPCLHGFALKSANLAKGNLISNSLGVSFAL